MPPSPSLLFSDSVAKNRLEISSPRELSIFDRAISSIETIYLEDLQTKFSGECHLYEALRGRGYAGHWVKHLDIPFWIKTYARIASLLDLDRSPPQTVFDLGAGGGHFAAIAQSLGHRVHCLDVENPLYDELYKRMGLSLTRSRIMANTALPHIADSADVIIANRIMFDSQWGLGEWKYFLEDLLENHLQESGRLLLGLNRNFRVCGRRFFNPFLMGYLEALVPDFVNRDRGEFLVSASALRRVHRRDFDKKYTTMVAPSGDQKKTQATQFNSVVVSLHEIFPDAGTPDRDLDLSFQALNHEMQTLTKMWLQQNLKITTVRLDAPLEPTEDLLLDVEKRLLVFPGSGYYRIVSVFGLAEVRILDL